MKDFAFQDVLFKFNEVSSTQEKAKEFIKTGEGGRIFIISAQKQTKGRGRMERKWDSSFVGNIYISICFTEEMGLEMTDILPLYTSFILINKIGEKAKYKWPNDVIIEGKKVAGILIERQNGFFIVGIGVNTLHNPEDTIFPAGNLAEFGISLNVEDVFKSFKENINLNPQFIINFLQNRFFTNDEVTINKGEFVGKMSKISPNGNLILKQRDGTLREISFGDVL
jgi:BirA family biotin operon repressor/biotin-[acetyl-CoA-carboxylase] ligase